MHTIKPNQTLCTIALAVSLALTACGGDSAEKSLAAAKAYLAKNDTAAATIELKNALAKDGNLGEARFLLGVALLEGGDAVAAEVEFKKALDAGYAKDLALPELARTLLMRGEARKVITDYANTKLDTAAGQAALKAILAQAYMATGNEQGARAANAEALAAQADYLPAQLFQVRLVAMDKELDKALAMLDGILANNEKSTEALMLKASLQLALGQPEGAIASYQKSLAVNPNLLGAHAALIGLHLQANKVDLAKAQLEALQKVAPKHPQTAYFQAVLAYQQRNLDQAYELVQPLLKNAGSDPRLLQLSGVIEFDKRMDIQAQEHLAQAVALSPGAVLARITLVRSYARTGQINKAISTLQPALSQPEPPAEILTLAGEVYLQNGDIDKAETYFNKASKANPDNPRNRTALALIHASKGDVSKGMLELEQIAAADAGVSADMALIATHMRQQQFDKALAAIANMEKKQPDNPVVYALRATALLGKKDVAGARKALERALEINPTFFQAAAMLARLDMADKKPADAAKRFENMLAKDPKNVQAYLALAELEVVKGSKPEVIAELLVKAITANPGEARPRAALIAHYLANKDAKQALTVAQEAMAAIPDQPEIMDMAGRAMQETGDFNQAMALYGKLISLTPNSAQAYLRLADVQMAAKQPDAARDTIAKGLKAQPDSLPLLRASLMLDAQAGRQSDAMAKARTLQKLHPRDATGYLAEGDLHAGQKAWNEALAAYRAGLKQTNAPELAVRIAAALSASGQSAELARHGDAWLKANPKDVVYRNYLASTAAGRNDYATALVQYRKIAELQPKDPAALNNLAWALGKTGDVKAGLALAEQANGLAPNQPALMDTWGVLLVQAGQTDKGLALLKKASELAPQAAEVRLNLARAYLKAGQKAEARTELETLAKLGDKFNGQKEVAELLKGL